jgi:hypothetical protein
MDGRSFQNVHNNNQCACKCIQKMNPTHSTVILIIKARHCITAVAVTTQYYDINTNAIIKYYSNDHTILHNNEG